MKTMTCNQLGGACEKKFMASTFEEMAKLSQEHGKEMFSQKDEAHLKAMQKMQALMQEPDGFKKWMSEKKREFESLPEN